MRLAQVRGAVLLAVGSDSAQGMAALERAVEGARTFGEPLYTLRALLTMHALDPDAAHGRLQEVLNRVKPGDDEYYSANDMAGACSLRTHDLRGRRNIHSVRASADTWLTMRPRDHPGAKGTRQALGQLLLPHNVAEGLGKGIAEMLEERERVLSPGV